MTPENESKSELTIPKERVTINIDKIDLEIVNSLIGVIGNSKSSVIYQMVKEWITQNSDKLMSMWEIDLAGIRRQVIAKQKGIKIEKELEALEIEIIKQLPDLFSNIESINTEELAEFLRINQRTLKKIIFTQKEELKKVGLKLVYKDGLIINKEIE